MNLIIALTQAWLWLILCLCLIIGGAASFLIGLRVGTKWRRKWL